MKAALKRIATVFMWIGLFFVALIILASSPIAFIFNLFRLFWKKQIGSGIDHLNSDMRKVNLTLDVLANVTVFNWFDNHTDRHLYGNSGETVSEVLYHRNKEGKLTKFDALIYKLVIGLDKKHFEVFEPKEGILKHL